MLKQDVARKFHLIFIACFQFALKRVLLGYYYIKIYPISFDPLNTPSAV